MITTLTSTCPPTLLDVCINAVAGYLPDQVQFSAEAIPAEHLQEAIWHAFCRRLQDGSHGVGGGGEVLWRCRALRQFVTCRPPSALVVNWSWLRSQALPALGPLAPHLRHLSLAGTNVDQLGALTPLTSLSCISLAHCNRLLPPTLSILTCLTQLEALDLSHTPHLGDAAAPHLAAMPRLRILQLSHSHVSDSTLLWLTYGDRMADWWDATAVLASHAGAGLVAGSTAEDTEQGVARRSALQRLHVAHTRVSAAGCQHLLALRQLQHLDVRGTGTPGAALRSLQHRFLLTVLQGAVLSRTPAPVGPTDLFVCCCDPTRVPPALGSGSSTEAAVAPHPDQPITQLPHACDSEAWAGVLFAAGVPANEADQVVAACHGGLEACVPQLLLLTQALSGCGWHTAGMMETAPAGQLLLAPGSWMG